MTDMTGWDAAAAAQRERERRGREQIELGVRSWIVGEMMRQRMPSGVTTLQLDPDAAGVARQDYDIDGDYVTVAERVERLQLEKEKA